jgi:acyl-coenzyme A thioesterase PaaI-like protein
MSDPSHSSVTVEIKANFLKPATGNYLIGKGRVISEGGSLIVATAEIYT